MKTLPTFFALLVLLFATWCRPTDSGVTNSQADTQKADTPWVALFDGGSFDGWRTFGLDSVRGWAIEDSCLTALGQGGDHANDLITIRHFKDFILEVEWKTSPQGNSGIFFYADDSKTDAIYEIAPEYQIIDDAGWPDQLEEWQKTGANYGMHPAPSDKKLKPVGEWNTSRIKVERGRVIHWLNGQKVVEYSLWSPDWEKRKLQGKWKDFPLYGSQKEGSIGLQDHGKKTWFRNIRIWDMGE